MPVADPSLPLQKAIVAALKADPAVNALVAGRVYDGVPANATKPYVSFGPFQVLPEGGDCLDGAEVSIQLDGWSTQNGSTVQAKQLGAAIAAALDEASFPLDAPQVLVDLALDNTLYQREADGLTAHAICIFTARTEPRDPDFPDASNTGVPAGAILVPATAPTITTPGAVVELGDFTGDSVVIDAPNVTLRKCRCQHDSIAAVYVSANGANAVIEDCDILGTAGSSGVKGVWVDGAAGVTVRRCDISGVEDGGYVFGDDFTAEANFVHDLASAAADPHYDGWQFDPPCAGARMLGNTIDNPYPQTSAITMGNNGGGITIAIAGNRLRGGGWTVNIDDDFAGFDPVACAMTNNRIGGGSAGHVTWDVDPPAPFTGNVDDDTGAPITF